MSESTDLIQPGVDHEQDTDPNAVVKYTQNMRYRIVNDLTNNGTKIPDKIGDLAMVLRDMDQSALTTRKLNIEERAANDGKRTLEAFDKLQAILGGRNPFQADGGGPIPVAARTDHPTQGLALPQVQLKPGEDHQGEHQLNVADYVPADE